MANNQIAILKGYKPEDLGLIPNFIDQDDPRPAREQFDTNYRHGGGWHPIDGFVQSSKGSIVLQYSDDPPIHPIATWPLRHELIVVYHYGFVAIFNTKTGDFEVARMD